MSLADVRELSPDLATRAADLVAKAESPSEKNWQEKPFCSLHGSLVPQFGESHAVAMFGDYGLHTGIPAILSNRGVPFLSSSS